MTSRSRFRATPSWRRTSSKLDRWLRALASACLLPLAGLACPASARRTPGEIAAASWVATPADTAGVLLAHRAWWHAYVAGDTLTLAARTSPALRLVPSSGLSYDRATTIAAALAHGDVARPAVDWSAETARAVAPAVALVTARAGESEGARRIHVRHLTVLERHERTWRVVAAQVTREEPFTPRAADASAAGALADFAGDYRMPRDGVLRIEVEQQALVLVEPSGRRLSMEPIGTGLFELATRSPLEGIVRVAFTRDASGRVTSMSRLVAGGAATFPRAR